jgi:hypothetical protein
LAVNGISIFTVFVPLMIFYFLVDRGGSHVYGLAPKKFDVKPYFIMLLLMLPVLITASFNKSFERQYPMYRTSEAHTYLGVPDWMTALSYEFAYGFDFITLELLFRGFMIIASRRSLGGAPYWRWPLCIVHCILENRLVKPSVLSSEVISLA